jgi:nucleoid DNA-binding protein
MEPILTTDEIQKSLAEKLEITQTDLKPIFREMVDSIRRHVSKRRRITIPNFGTFVTRKKEKRKAFNPLIQKHMLLPPKISLIFRPSSKLKERVKDKRFE